MGLAKHGEIKTSLRWLITNLNVFTIGDLVRASGLNPNSIRTEINRLVRAGVIDARPSTEIQTRAGRPISVYFITEGGKEILGSLIVKNEINLPLFEITTTAKTLKNFELEEIASLTGYSIDLCENILYNLCNDGWLKLSENHFEVIPDEYGINKLPERVRRVERLLHAKDEYTVDSEYYYRAIELLRHIEEEKHIDDARMIKTIIQYLDYARVEINTKAGKAKDVANILIDAAYVKIMILAGEAAKARDLGISVVNKLLENGLFEDAKVLASLLEKSISKTEKMHIIDLRKALSLKESSASANKYYISANPQDTAFRIQFLRNGKEINVADRQKILKLLSNAVKKATEIDKTRDRIARGGRANQLFNKSTFSLKKQTRTYKYQVRKRSKRTGLRRSSVYSTRVHLDDEE